MYVLTSRNEALRLPNNQTLRYFLRGTPGGRCEAVHDVAVVEVHPGNEDDGYSANSRRTELPAECNKVVHVHVPFVAATSFA